MRFGAHYAGRQAVVLGASEGLGRDISIALAAAGASLVVAARCRIKLAALENDLRAQFPGLDLSLVPLDVRDGTALQQMAAEWPQAEFLFNCAGFAQAGYLEELELDLYREMLEVNALGTLLACRAFVPGMKRQGKGTIVNVSSMAGLLGLFGYTGYCASKFAVVGLSMALRHELAPHGIAVHLHCPPNMDTPGFARESVGKPAEVAATEQWLPQHDPRDVARRLLSDLPGGRFLLFADWRSRAIYHLHRLFPSIVSHFLKAS